MSARDQLLHLEDAIGEPLDTPLALVNTALPPNAQTLPTRSEAVGIAFAHEPKVLMAEQDVEKARASIRVAEDAYIPSITALAHDSYQDGIALFFHNYGIFEGSVHYDLFDGGTRRANVRDARASLSKAELALSEQKDQTRIAVESSYDQLELGTRALDIAQQVTKARIEEVRVAEVQFQQGEILPSQRANAQADLADAEASALQAALNLDLARNQIREILGQIAN